MNSNISYRWIPLESNPSIFNFVSNFILGYFCFSIGNILKEKQVWLFQIKKSGLKNG